MLGINLKVNCYQHLNVMIRSFYKYARNRYLGDFLIILYARNRYKLFLYDYQYQYQSKDRILYVNQKTKE